MEKLKLVLPSPELESEFLSYRQEFLDAGDSMDGCGPMRRISDIEEYIRESELYRNPETLPEGKVTATQFFCVRESDGKVVGMIQVRHYLNDYLRQFGGHIGYSVRPSERRKGYASRMLHDALDFCRSLGLDRVMVTCYDTNEASRKTILKNGGVYEGKAFEPDDGKYLERYWIDLK